MNKKYILGAIVLIAIVIVLITKKETRKIEAPERVAPKKSVVATPETKKKQTAQTSKEEKQRAESENYPVIDKTFIKSNFTGETLPFISEGKYSVSPTLRACPKSQYRSSFGEKVMDSGAVTYFKKTDTNTDLLSVDENNYPVVLNRQNDGLAYLTGGFSIEIMSGESINELTDKYSLKMKYHLKGTQRYYLSCDQCDISKMTKLLSEDEVILEAVPEVIQFVDAPR